MPRFTPSKYDPLADSDTGSAMSYTQLVALQRELKGVVLGVQPGDCPCGCGQPPKGKKATYAMGHDARYRGKLIRAHMTDTPVWVVTDGKNQRHTAEELAEVAGESFVSSLRDNEQRRKQANAKLVQKAVGSSRLIRVGRWDYTGQVAAVYSTPNGDEYDVEYVTKQGQTRKVRVPADQTKEV